jgi:soluble lytic murein transglycosylase
MPAIGLVAVMIAAVLASGAIVPTPARAALVPELKSKKPKVTKLGRIITLVRKDHLTKARSAARTLKDPVAQKLVRWLILQSPYSSAGHKEIHDFLAANPYWPRGKALRARAEGAQLPRGKTPKSVLAFFKDAPPQSGAGMIAYARSFKKSGDTEKAREWARRAWRSRLLSASLEKNLLKDMKSLLGPSDHRVRFAYLTYRRNIRAIRRHMRQLAKSEKLIARVTIALLRGRRWGIRRYKKLKSSLKYSVPLRYAVVRYRRRKEKTSKVRHMALEIATHPAKAVYPKAWWIEHQALARRAVGDKAFKDAYRLASEHALTSGHHFAQAEFLAGWIALTRLDNPADALKHFRNLRNGVKTTRSVARAEYWLARAHMKRREHTKARKHFLAAATHYKTYYGQLARDQLAIDLPAPPELPTRTSKTRFEDRELVKVIRLLHRAKHRSLLLSFFRAAFREMHDGADMAALSRLAYKLGHPNIGIRIAKYAAEKGHHLGTLAYPAEILPRYRRLNGAVEPALIHGLIRQESEFNAKAISSAGARGLMQIMPSTARLLARRHKQRYRRKNLTVDPSYNLRLGTAYLSGLITKFKGSYILAAAGYNAGPGRAKRWVDRYGDPRRGTVDPIDWVESIPFNETRDYVQKVMENTQIYRRHFTGDQQLALFDDLVRGKPVPKSATKPKAKKKTKTKAKARTKARPRRKTRKRRTARARTCRNKYFRKRINIRRRTPRC